MDDSEQLYLRKCTLMLVEGQNALDLSEMHITFETRQEDEESPNNARIRVHNLAPDTVRKIKGEFSRVVLQAGYENASFGVIFDGTIKQWGEGREPNKVDTYLDILAADGDVAYNNSVINMCLAKGSTREQRIYAAVKAFTPEGLKAGKLIIPSTGGVLPRGKVLFGLARAALRSETQNCGTTWNISAGSINVVPLAGYLPGQAVVLNSMTGLIGRAEQTELGVKARCLINPRITVGGLVQLDEDRVNRLTQQKDHVIPGAQLPYNQWTGIQNLANVTTDGLYRVYVAEYRGNTRGQDWYMDLILLAIDPVNDKVKDVPYG